MIKIVIVDFGMGNLNSIIRRFTCIGINALISSLPIEILNADKLILPGVGHFKKAVENLNKSGLWESLNNAVLVKKTPILGICLGMQLMAKHSEEGDIEGFGWFDADVIRFRIADNLKFKVPHMGWNQISIKKTSPLFENVDLDSEFYFVHSYHIMCYNKSDVLNETTYEYPFVSAVQRDNIFGVQYHPEKSHDAGEHLLKNFIEL